MPPTFAPPSAPLALATAASQVPNPLLPLRRVCAPRAVWAVVCSTPDNPKWWMVDVQLVRRLARPVTLAELRAEGAKAGSPVASMVLINK